MKAQRLNDSLYAELKQAGVPMSNHESDLYFPVTDQTRAILDRWPANKATTSTFINQVEGGLWFDAPFAFIPWEGRQKGRTA